ncbi:MAG: NAD(P)H-dependent oxidoreductase [Spirochaetota bacterium]
MKSILIILGHPGAESLCHTLAEDYRRGAEAGGARVEVLDLGSLRFDPDLAGGLHDPSPLEPDLVGAQVAIARADHLVFIHPNWWGTYPARLKAFVDRTFLPGFAFQYQKGSPFPAKLLTGKTARLVVTMDGPGWWYRWAMGAGGDRALTKSVLRFCGVRTLGAYHADKLRSQFGTPVAKHRKAVEAWGRRDAA